MANKTKADVKNQVYEYIPQMSVAAHGTTLTNLIDLAAEEISFRHNFSYFAADSPASVTIATGSMTANAASFATFTNKKEILNIEWIKSSTGEYGEVKWMPLREFLKKYPYHDYGTRTRGKPSRYTRSAGKYVLNVPADETITLRAWYQKFHGAFSTNTTTHDFEPNMLGFQAIVSCVLSEAHDLIPGIEMSQKAMMEMQKKESYIQQLIEFDKTRANEGIELQENVDSDGIAPDESPYGWAA